MDSYFHSYSGQTVPYEPPAVGSGFRDVRDASCPVCRVGALQPCRGSTGNPWRHVVHAQRAKAAQNLVHVSAILSKPRKGAV